MSIIKVRETLISLKAHLDTMPGFQTIHLDQYKDQPGLLISKPMTGSLEILEKVAKIAFENNAFCLEFYPGALQSDIDYVRIHLRYFESQTS